MKAKLMVSQGFLYRLANPEEFGINLDRYQAFRDVFGAEDFGIVLAGDVFKEAITGERASCFTLDSRLAPIERPKEGVEASLFLASGFDTTRGEIPSRAKLVSIMSHLDRLRLAGVIGGLVNPLEATLYEDKLTSVQELEGNGIRTPRTYHFSDLSGGESFLRRNRGESYILKHRFGENGRGIRRVNVKNIGELPSNIAEYIFQEEMDIVDERRIVACCGEILGGRVIIDRTRPWEKKSIAGRQHKAEFHSPTKGEARDTLKIFKNLGAVLGCVDWVTLRDGGSCFLEFNGVGTGYGYPGGVYDLNGAVAEKLAAEYLK
jgi:hypothetical protein